MINYNIDLEGKTILVTGAVGFIGASMIQKLYMEVQDIIVIGIDNMNDYYDPALKEARMQRLAVYSSFVFIKGNIADKNFIDNIFEKYRPQIVMNFAAQAGVRHSIVDPDIYMESNVMGFYNILEACRYSYQEGETGVEHLVYASSSSVYGMEQKKPYSIEDRTDWPVSLYAATKKTDELLAYAYSKLYGIPSTGLRFFTVYGPMGRPDMSYFKFTDKLLKGEKIRIFNFGNCKRDFTYIDDITEAIFRAMQHAPEKSAGKNGLFEPPYIIYNIGNGNPQNLLEFVKILEQELIRAGIFPEDYDFEAYTELTSMQPGDVPVTYADTKELERDFDFRPDTDLRCGLRKFVEWYREFYIG